MSKIVAAYIDQVSEQMVAAYAEERENWLRNRSAAGIDADIHFAFGDAARGSTGFRLTHQQAIAAQAVALASGSPAPRAVAFGQVAPVAMMLSARELLRPWVLSTLADLALDDEHHARLRETL
ncbi:MAG TPA: hypothetical protein VIZ43_16190, partial [Trebonia sp.]